VPQRHVVVTSAAVALLAVIAVAGCGSADADVASAAVDDYTANAEADPGAPSPRGTPSTLGADASVDDPTRDDASSTGDGSTGNPKDASTPPVPWSCTGSYGTTKASDGDYYLTAFGCWKDAQGVSHGDGQDNCIPSCLAQARSSGLCMPGDTGKQCEERVTWYTADAARFGCLARLKVTNPANGKLVIAVALDFGPSCSAVEAKVKKAVLDASGRVDRQLFGSDQGVLDRSLVHVTEVPASTPLGPTP
jgi:hypothetical protein